MKLTEFKIFVKVSIRHLSFHLNEKGRKKKLKKSFLSVGIYIWTKRSVWNKVWKFYNFFNTKMKTKMYIYIYGKIHVASRGDWASSSHCGASTIHRGPPEGFFPIILFSQNPRNDDATTFTDLVLSFFFSFLYIHIYIRTRAYRRLFRIFPNRSKIATRDISISTFLPLLKNTIYTHIDTCIFFIRCH